MNTTDSAVRVTHLPTGTVVSMQDEKSQAQNKAKALAVLRSRPLKAEQDRQADEASAARKGQVGGGGRAEKVRTYNFKENRVTDHRIGLTVYKLDKVLAGELDEISDALVADEQARRLGDGVLTREHGHGPGARCWTTCGARRARATGPVGTEPAVNAGRDERWPAAG